MVGDLAGSPATKTSHLAKPCCCALREHLETVILSVVVDALDGIHSICVEIGYHSSIVPVRTIRS